MLKFQEPQTGLFKDNVPLSPIVTYSALSGADKSNAKKRFFIILPPAAFYIKI
jgi:hypothetical protein